MPSADKSIGRVYLEAAVDLSQLNKGFDQMVKAITDVDGKVKAYGDKLKASFEAAYNPTQKLGAQLEALAKQGKTAGELIAVFGDRIQKTMETVARTGAAPNAMVKNLSDQMAIMAKKTEEATESAGTGFKKFGQILSDLVAHPLQTAQLMLTRLVEGIGPIGIGFLGIGTAIAAGATAIYKFVSAAHEVYEQLENMSLMTGISINDLKALKKATEEAGFESLDLGRSLSYINDQLASTGKAGDLQKGMDALGISAHDANGQLKDALVIVDELAAKIAQSEDPVRQASDMIAVFGIRYRELGAFALKSGGHIRDTVKEIQASGGSYTKVAEDMLEDMHTAQKETTRYFDALKNSWLTSLGEIWGGITGLKDKITGLPAWFQRFIGVSIQTQNQFPSVQPGKPEELVGPPDPGLPARMRAIEERTKAMTEAAKKAVEELQKIQQAELKYLQEQLRAEEKVKNQADFYADEVERAAKAWEKNIAELRRMDPLMNAAEDWAKSWLAVAQMKPIPLFEEPPLGRTFGDFMKGLPAINKEIDTFVAKNERSAQSVAEVWRNQVSTIVTDWSRGIADILVEGGDFGKKLTDIFKETAKSILRTLIESLFNPLKDLLNKVIKQIFSALTGQSAGTATAGVGLGALAGAALNPASLAATGGLTASLMALMSPNKYAKGAGAVGLFGVGNAVAVSAITGMPLSTALMTTLINPITAAIAGGVIGIIALVDAFTHDAWEAGVMELKRDLGGLKIKEKDWRSWIQNTLGLSEEQAYPIRKDIMTSPLFISQVAVPAAQSQGRLDALLKSLEKVTVDTRIAASGFLNFRAAVEQGIQTGNWEAFNKQWNEAFQKSQALTAIMPDFASKLDAVSSAASEAADAATGLSSGMQALLDAILSTKDAADDMYGTFLKTGEILPQLAAEIQKYGGNLEVFQRYASLGGLRENLTAIGNLISGLSEILPDLDPIQKLLSGGGVDWTGMQAMGVDPSKLIGIADLVAFESRWEDSVKQFQDTGRLLSGSVLQQALWKFGGTAGATALSRWDQGFNTITPGLLDATKAAMDIAYKTERMSAMDYLKTVQTTMESEIESATNAIVAELQKILAAIQAGNAGQPATAAAVTAQGGTYIDMRGATVYGYEDFESRVQTAWTTAHRRGAFSYAIP